MNKVIYNPVTGSNYPVRKLKHKQNKTEGLWKRKRAVRVLITGGKGFIGKHLASGLSQTGDIITSLDTIDGRDIRNLEQVREAIQGKDIVFHLAAIADLNWAYIHPVETMKVNVEGTWNIAIACLEAKAKLYYASTACVYGNQEHHPSTEESPPNPAEIYACTKLAGENVIRGLHHSFGLEYNFMRFATIYGEGMRSALAPHIFLGQALRGEPITVHGEGKQTRTLTYIDDLIDAIVVLYQSGRVNGIWNMTTSRTVSAIQMAKDIKEITGSKSEIVSILQRIGQTFQEEISADKMLRETGWGNKVDWEEGLRRTYQWFKETEQVNNVYQKPE